MPTSGTSQYSLQPSMNRRRFLCTAAMASAATFAAPAFLRGGSPNEKLSIAVVGVGGRGGGNLQSVASENIVALCDVNANNLDKAAAAYPKARRFEDFRKLYDHAGEFDSVVSRVYAERAARALSSLHVPVTLDIVEDLGHALSHRAISLGSLRLLQGIYEGRRQTLH